MFKHNNSRKNLPVSDLHTIYVEESGNKNGKPVIFLHGGPGGGVDPKYRRYFNPDKWHIIMFDQRGCGKSTPFAELKENSEVFMSTNPVVYDYSLGRTEARENPAQVRAFDEEDYKQKAASQRSRLETA